MKTYMASLYLVAFFSEDFVQGLGTAGSPDAQPDTMRGFAGVFNLSTTDFVILRGTAEAGVDMF